jgi:hypothetical protein
VRRNVAITKCPSAVAAIRRAPQGSEALKSRASSRSWIRISAGPFSATLGIAKNRAAPSMSPRRKVEAQRSISCASAGSAPPGISPLGEPAPEPVDESEAESPPASLQDQRTSERAPMAIAAASERLMTRF